MAKYTSELDTESEFSKEENLRKRTTKKNFRYFSPEEDTSPPEKMVRKSPRFQLPTPPINNSQLASTSHSETSVLKRNLNLEKEGTTTSLKISNSNSDSSNTKSNSSIAAKYKCLSCKDSTEIIRLLLIINGRVTQNSDLIMTILNSRNESNIQDDNPDIVDIDIPAKSCIELMELDKKWSDKNTRVFMVNKLVHVGGINVKDVIKRCMPQIVDDDVLRQFSWVGGKGKKKFSTLAMASLVKEVCKKNPLITNQFTEKEVEDRLALFLTKASEGCNRRMNKEKKQNDRGEESMQ